MTSNRFVISSLLGVHVLMALVSTVRGDEAADHAALQSLVKEYEAAVQRADPLALEPYLAPGFTGVMITGEAVDGFESLEAYWNKIQSLLGEGGKYGVTVNIAGPATIVGDVAFAHGTTDDIAVTGSGKEYDFQGFWTAICTRQEDGWKIQRIHGSMDAITNPFITPMLRVSAITGGLVGGVIGFLIGAILLWMIGRRRQRATTA